jgi:ATP-dependent RNA helicase DeaD
MQNTKFSELGLSENIMKAIEEMGYTETTPIQSAAIPVVMSGVDVIGQAQTGTGKTAAFGIPAIESIDVNDRSTQVLIMCPTRELALQVKEQICKLAKHVRGLTVAAIFGGESYDRQFRNLEKGSQIVVGTPGRIMDHIDRKTLKLENLSMLILDEADEMLNMGFREDIEKILSFAPVERQTVLFSATMSKDILSITKRFQNKPEIIKVTRNEITNDNIEQQFFMVKREAKVEVMTRLIDIHDLQLMLVFCNTKMKVDEVVIELQERGYAAEGIHGDLRQAARNQVMNKFRNGNTTILVATDVAARGIDVSGVDAVFNFDVPLDLEYYVHRIGRTGRAGKLGKAFMLVTSRDKSKLWELERYTKVAIPQGQIPMAKDLQAMRQQRFVEQVKASITEETDTTYDAIIEKLADEGFDNHSILTALMRMQLGSSAPVMKDEDLFEQRREKGSRNERSGGSSFDRRGGNEDRGRSRSGDRGGDREYRNPRGANESRGGFDGERRERRPQNSGPEQGMVKVFISLGRKDHVSPNHIVGAIAAESKIPGRVIGSIDIQDRCSYVDIPERDVQKVLKAMKGKTINAQKANFELV